MSLQIAHTREELATALSGSEGTRAVVMTMGALHAGHLELVRRARERAEVVVVTIFVNPLQFGEGEDLDRYPRDLDRDLALLADVGADLVFAPEPRAIYPDGKPLVQVSAGQLGTVLEGLLRPGHFDGVLTVVLKLMNLVQPQVAFFGEKDAQQLIAIRRMVRDLDLPIAVEAVATVRDSDGLALSSRNAYLDAEQRMEALSLSAALRAAAASGASGAGHDEVLAAARAILSKHPAVTVNYLVLVDPTTLVDVGVDFSGSAIMLVAAYVGSTHLIDNIAVSLSGSRL